METKRWIQLDILDTEREDLVKINIYFDGRCYPAFMAKSEYELMLHEQPYYSSGREVL
jgi:hypothetical protein